MNSKLEYRTSATLRAASNSAFELAGLAAAYNKLSGDLGGFRERIAPGAFTRALASTPDVLCTINHDISKLLGRTTSGTLSLSDSPEGLRFVCKLDPAQQSHKDLYASVKRGDMSECSFAFSPADGGDKWDDAKDERGQRFSRRTLTNLNLFDVAVVTRPAYPGSTNVGARSSAVVVPARLQVSLEEQYRRQTGRVYISDQDLRMKLSNLGAQVRADARALAADKELRERVEAAGLRIQVDALIEEMFED
jgi:HK97 family phage prohead protease